MKEMYGSNTMEVALDKNVCQMHSNVIQDWLFAREDELEKSISYYWHKGAVSAIGDSLE